MSIEATMASKESSFGESSETPTQSSGATESAAASVPGKGEAKSTASATEGSSQTTEKDIAPPVEKIGEDGEEEEVKFTPKNKFKVMDKEHDVPPWLLSAMKDPETEKQALDLLCKVEGFPHTKAHLEQRTKERDEVRAEHQKTLSDINEVRQLYRKGDIDLFLDKLAIPHERMLQWAVDRLQYSQLPPDQQRVIDERRDAQRKAYDAEKQVGNYEQQLQEVARSAKSQLLQAGLNRPDVKAFADSYDSRAGKPGEFLNEVIAEGNLAWATSNGKVDLTPDQAIERVMGKWSKFLQPGETGATAPVVVPGPGAIAPPVAAKPAVIPNVAGRSTSPMKSKPRSLDELKKLGKEMAAASQH